MQTEEVVEVTAENARNVNTDTSGSSKMIGESNTKESMKRHLSKRKTAAESLFSFVLIQRTYIELELTSDLRDTV